MKAQTRLTILGAIGVLMVGGCAAEGQKRGTAQNASATSEESTKETDNGELSLSMPDFTHLNSGISQDSFTKVEVILCPEGIDTAKPTEQCVVKNPPLIGDRSFAIGQLNPGKYALLLLVKSNSGVVLSGSSDVLIEAGKVSMADLTLEKVQDATKGGLVIKINPPKPQPPVERPEPNPPVITKNNAACVELVKLKKVDEFDCQAMRVYCEVRPKYSSGPLASLPPAIAGEMACTEKFARLKLLDKLCNKYTFFDERDVKLITCKEGLMISPHYP